MASGPSLTAEDVVYASARVDGVIAINNSIFLAPWADVLYASDTRWWLWHAHELDEAITTWRYTLQTTADPFATRLQNAGPQGIAPSADSLKHGYQSGHAAINLAAHLVGKGGRIVLLGYDLRVDAGGRQHWHADHPNGTHPNYNRCLMHLPTVVEPLERMGIAIVNCSPQTSVRGIPRLALREALP